MKLSLRTLLPMTAIVVAAVALTACGSSNSTSTKAASSSSSTTTKPAANATVKTATNATLGTILVDAQGRTLYTLTNGGADTACDATCMGAWPPVVVAAGGTSATGGPGVPKKLAVVVIPAGKQVQFDGHSLYTFVQDTAAGDAKGQGLQSFGGTWNVVKVAGGTAGSNTTSTTSRSGSGY